MWAVSSRGRLRKIPAGKNKRQAAQLLRGSPEYPETLRACLRASDATILLCCTRSHMLIRTLSSPRPSPDSALRHTCSVTISVCRSPSGFFICGEASFLKFYSEAMNLRSSAHQCYQNSIESIAKNDLCAGFIDIFLLSLWIMAGISGFSADGKFAVRKVCGCEREKFRLAIYLIPFGLSVFCMAVKRSAGQTNNRRRLDLTR